MKRKIDLVEEEHESEHEESESSDDESENEEPRIKDVLNNLSNAVSRKHASELLHSMAASKNILFWTPSGQTSQSWSSMCYSLITKMSPNPVRSILS